MSEPQTLPSVLVVTGTGTGVGKTIATAAIAAVLLGRGLRIAVVKPAQTGITSREPSDLDVVCRLVGPAAGGRLTVHEGVRLGDPLAPATAARREGRTIPMVADHVRIVTDLVASHDIVIIEGAGGLLVELDTRGGTLADLAVALRYKGIGVGVVVVCPAGLGTLNHTALTAEALRSRSLGVLGLVVGSWPVSENEADLAMHENLADLPRIAAAPLLGRLPAGAGGWRPEDFAAAAPSWLAL
ncbi:MAG: dethiobiotin synthase [Candidatus Phosphoribacter sp.]